MHTPPIPDHNYSPAQLPMQLFDEVHHLGRRDVVIVQPEVQTDPQRPGSQAQRAQHAKAIVSIPRVLDGRLSAGRPRATPERLQHEPAFVEKHDASFLLAPLFLSAATPAVANAEPR